MECSRNVETSKTTTKVVRNWEKEVERFPKKMKAVGWGKLHADEKKKKEWKVPSVKKGIMELVKKRSRSTQYRICKYTSPVLRDQ